MASIYGVTIAGITKNAGNDDSSLAQGTVYLNGKELGQWAQEEYGGPNIYRFDPFRLRGPAQQYFDHMSNLEKKVYEMLYCKNGKICIDFCDVLLADLVFQMDLEKEYMRHIKDGPCTLVTFQHEKSASEMAARPYSVSPIRKACFSKSPMYKDEVKNLIIQKGLDDAPHIVRIYNRPEDFIIGINAVKKKHSKSHHR